MIKVKVEVKPYELDGEQTRVGEPLVVHVESHSIWDDRVIVQFGDGKRVTLLARDLHEAVINCTRTAR